MATKAEYGSLPFKPQIAYFKQKTNISTDRWADVWKEAHNRGFMIAGATRDDLLADFRIAVDKAISEGRSLSQFKSDFNSIVKRHGWEFNGAASWRANVIYDTNMRQSYNAGREAQMQAMKHRRPYGIYKHTPQEHPREEHLKWDDTVLPLDDPWWSTHSPSNGFYCKCKKFSLSKNDLKRRGLSVSQSPDVKTYEWVDKVTGEVHEVPKGIDPSFDYTPTTPAEQTKRLKQNIEAKPLLEERLTPRIVKSAYSTVKGVNAMKLSEVLAGLDSPNLDLVGEIINKNDLKTLFVKQSEMSGKARARAIKDDVESYIQSGQLYPQGLYYHRRPARVGGFTSAMWKHVVVKVSASNSLAKVDITAIANAVEAVINNKEKPFTFSLAIGEATNDSHRVISTWLHEMGHQVHYKAGVPVMPGTAGLTNYADASQKEWFAEHFVAWALAPDALQLNYPDIFSIIDATVRTANENS